MEEKLQDKYVDLIKDDIFLRKKKLNKIAMDILPKVNIDDVEEIENLLLREFMEDVPEASSKTLIDNLEQYEDILIDFINSKVKDVKNYGEGGVFETDPEMFEITVANKNYKVIIAKTDSEKDTGLQNVEELDGDEGMLFDYSDESPTELSF